MSEQYEHPDQMMLHMSNGDFLMTRENASLYTFWGELATRDHIFLQTGEGEDENTVTGTYIFNWSAAYETLANFMAEHQYPCHLNRLDVPECDARAWEAALGQLNGGHITDDEIPEEWYNDGKGS